MPTATILPLPRAVFYDASGNPLTGGFVYTYIPGGTVPKGSWQDAAETIANANPIVLDADGSAIIYGSGYYQMTVTDALGNQIPAYSGLTQDFLSVVAAAVDTLGFITAVADIDALRALATGASPVWVDGVASGMFNLGVPSGDNGGTIIVSGAGTYYREPAGEAFSLSWFGAVGDGTIDDTDAIDAAQPTWTFITSGTYKTTIAPNAFDGAFWGTGQIIDSAGNKRGKFFSELQSAPTSVNNPASVETAFNGDWSRQTFAIEHRIYGDDTLGEPTTGYQYTPNAYPIFGFLYNASGWNQATDGNVGRTAAVFSQVFATNAGQGDCVAYNAEVTVNSTRAGATSWLANPAGTIINGDVSAGVDGCYLNPFEMNMIDNGHDVAAIGLVNNFLRTNGTQALGESWIGYRAQSSGSQPIDAGMSLAGLFKWGADFTTGTYSNNQAIGLAASQRVYFNASNTGGFPNGTVNGDVYITYDAGGGTLGLVNGTELLSLSPSAVTTNAQTIFGGNITPFADNLYTCGASGARWAALWAANGTIQTSDATLKTDIASLPAALPILNAINPVTFRWKDGGYDTVAVDEERDVPEMETVSVESSEIRMIDGVATLVTGQNQIKRQLFDTVPVVDAAGAPVMINVAAKSKPSRMVQKMHQVPRMVKGTASVKKNVARGGRRTHWGFLATEIKAATPEGLDWGAYVKGDDGVEGIRPDQMLPVVWQAAKELYALSISQAEKIKSLEAAVAEIKQGLTHS